jgi:hypothetical protein
MPKFYSQQAYQKLVAQYIANGFSLSAAEEMVNSEEADAMQEYDEWLDEVNATAWHMDDIDN